MQPSRSPATSADEVVLTQGILARLGGQLLALGDTMTGDDGVRRTVVSLEAEGGPPSWHSRVLLRAGDVFPARTGFLRLQRFEPGGAGDRARAVVAAATDTGGIAAPAAGDRVLVQAGRVRFAGRWIEAVTIDGGEAVLEHWPATQARSRLADDAVARQRVRAGDTLDLGPGAEPLRVERVQPAAGEVLGFVAFAPEPARSEP